MRHQKCRKINKRPFTATYRYHVLKVTRVHTSILCILRMQYIGYIIVIQFLKCPLSRVVEIWFEVHSCKMACLSVCLNRIVVDQACLQGAASPEELVKRLGGSRVITKILIANNGIAAVSWISVEFL